MTINLNDALRFDPFDGDFGSEVTISDKIVSARKCHPACHSCTSRISRGEMHRVRTERDIGGGLRTFRWCNACTIAMCLSGEDVLPSGGPWAGMAARVQEVRADLLDSMADGDGDAALIANDVEICDCLLSIIGLKERQA